MAGINAELSWQELFIGRDRRPTSWFLQFSVGAYVTLRENMTDLCMQGDGEDRCAAFALWPPMIARAPWLPYVSLALGTRF
jgi:hypothetical protein